MSADKTAQLAINSIRSLAIDAIQKANSGHPGTPQQCAKRKSQRAGSMMCLRIVRLNALVLSYSPITKIAVELFSLNAPDEYFFCSPKECKD